MRREDSAVGWRLEETAEIAGGVEDTFDADGACRQRSEQDHVAAVPCHSHPPTKLGPGGIGEWHRGGGCCGSLQCGNEGFGLPLAVPGNEKSNLLEISFGERRKFWDRVASQSAAILALSLAKTMSAGMPGPLSAPS